MSNRPIIAKDGTALRETKAQEWEIVDPPTAASTRAFGPFASFTYSVTEVSSSAGRTRVKSSTTRLTDGKLVSETFAGELDASAYERMVQQASAQFANQLKLMMLPFSWMLPRARDSDQ